MTLEQYRVRHRLTQAQLARQLGVDESQVSRWIKWDAKPSAETIYMIQRETGGLVTLADWVEST